MNFLAFVGVFLVAVFGATAWNHYQLLGGFSVVYLLVIFFLSLNMLVCLWERVLYLRIDLIEKKNADYRRRFPADKNRPVLDFIFSKVAFSNLFSADYWSDVWATYSLFDGSYADKRTLGFNLDVGNGYWTLIPCLLLHLGFTYHFLPPNVIGIIALCFFYQVVYCTSVYWFSFFNVGRQRLNSRNENLVYIWGTNCPWVLFGLVGMYAAVRLILDNSWAVFGN
ncbi:conserved membrane protein of unknown function [Sterolibacterium denitrificans]|uniref:Uncharacterized protein n=1 Tax=Sterolibacterium denitrificans TaxID=157592 RepID=A0A7Z7MVT2_9PROT|nr:hypothetical protein [Sterolibacterium denitrificans]SMB29204.1 conserved membrane protein of unknown function [Sterolibacterium denitrificans]